MMRGQSQQTTAILTNEVNEQITDAMKSQTRGMTERLQIHRGRDHGMSVVAFERPGSRELDSPWSRKMPSGLTHWSSASRSF
jgi:hypothetical protein